MHPLVVAITGASGAPYAVRLLDVLEKSGFPVHFTISPAGAQVIKQELDLDVDLKNPDLSTLIKREPTGELHYHFYQDFMCPIASGSFKTSGMVIVPCSGSTLGGVAAGASGNLIHRAADVHLKERRKLVMVTRETPLSLIHINNMKIVTEAGATVLPAMPGWYHGVETLDDLIDFIVARILDQFDIDNSLMTRWGS